MSGLFGSGYLTCRLAATPKTRPTTDLL
ncbi:MAG: hypothetical protein QOK15_892, partial [Nocardioidaceae bacterium]|nr:hypothetical protein [Nocardioidaceae bacterium]